MAQDGDIHAIEVNVSTCALCQMLLHLSPISLNGPHVPQTIPFYSEKAIFSYETLLILMAPIISQP